MPKFHHESTAFLSMREEPMSALARALELQNPNSFEYKKLMDVYQTIEDKHELCVQFLYELAQATQQEEKEFAQQISANILREEAREKRAAAIERNEEIAEEKEKSVKELHRELTAKIKNIKELDKKLYQFENLKQDIDYKITEKDKEIKVKEIEWKHSQVEAAEKFVKDNFVLNPDGKYTSVKHPVIALLDGAIDIIKKVFTDGKSPAEMQKHNPELLNDPERMMRVDDIRKDITLARKIHKIVGKEEIEKANQGRKVKVSRPVFDEDGNRVYVIDAQGKKRGKTEIVYEDPVTEKRPDMMGSNESTKKENRNLCLGNVCLIRDKLLAKQCSHTPEDTKIATTLLVMGSEKSQLEGQSKEYAEKINATKAEIAAEKKGVDQTYAKIAELHPDQQIAKPLEIDETHDQVFLGKQQNAAEKPQLKTADPLTPDKTHDQVLLDKDETKEEEKLPRFHK